MMASEVMDFPEPDSPTKPRTSPGAMEKDKRRTAATDVFGVDVGCCPGVMARPPRA